MVILHVSKEGFTKIINFMIARAGVLVRQGMAMLVILCKRIISMGPNAGRQSINM